ncbi:MAG: magnesium chelatase subunit D [Roseinatronobacter sp.]
MTPFDETAHPPDRPPRPLSDLWAQVALALSLLAIDPVGLRGLWLRGRAGPVRARVLAALTPLGPRKVHPYMTDDALHGGLDLSATLATGQMQRHAGLLAQPGLLVLTMAERCPAGLAVQLGQALDTGAGLSLIALDEAAEESEGLPPALSDRLGLFLSLDFAWSDTSDITLPVPAIQTARACLAQLRPSPAQAERLVRLCAQLGIASARAPLLALAAARAHAASRGAERVEDTDLEAAVALTLAHRATALPPAETQDQNTPPPPETTPDQAPDQDQSQLDLPDDLLIEAARAAIPSGLLARLQASKLARVVAGGNSGAGAVRKSKRRGRPMPSRAGKPGSGAKVDIIATLRQAAPWQKLRAGYRTAQQGRLLLMPSDIRIRAYKEQTDRVLIFVVDASGSSALARLAEAKGAVELMLADAYSSRDHVALVTFRGKAADVTLPPTRSLVQAKRRLGGVPGGGATPLAQGLATALQVAAQARAQGMTPTLALLTDGRGNIALDGSADRVQANADAEKLARLIAAQGLPALVIDTGLRPQPALRALAATMGAMCIALPRADARAMAGVMGAALGKTGGV